MARYAARSRFEPDYCPASAATIGCHVRQKCSLRKVKKGCGRCGPGIRSCGASKKLNGNQRGTCGAGSRRASPLTNPVGEVLISFCIPPFEP